MKPTLLYTSRANTPPNITFHKTFFDTTCFVSIYSITWSYSGISFTTKVYKSTQSTDNIFVGY